MKPFIYFCKYFIGFAPELNAVMIRYKETCIITYKPILTKTLV